MKYGHVSISYSVQEGQSFFRIVGTVEKIVRPSFNFTFSTTAEGVRESWKLCLNLCSLRWLKPSLSRDRSFIPLGLWQLNALLADGLMNDRILFRKVTILSVEFLISQSNLFRSIIVEGKKFFLKKLCFAFIAGILLHCFVLYDILCMGIIEYRHFRDCDLVFCENHKVFYTNVAVEKPPSLVQPCTTNIFVFFIMQPWKENHLVVLMERFTLTLIDFIKYCSNKPHQSKSHRVALLLLSQRVTATFINRSDGKSQTFHTSSKIACFTLFSFNRK